MTWIQTHSGRAVDLLKPKPNQIYAGDIIRTLARIPRFNAHTLGPRPYTVALHSVYVHRICKHASPDDRAAHLWALLHDAAEAYIGDMATPVQEALGLRKPGSRYRKMHAAFDRVIAAHFGLTYQQLKESELIVKRCDLLALQAERAAYMSKSDRPWTATWNANLPAKGPAVTVLKPCSPRAAEALFTRTLAMAIWELQHGGRR